MLYTRDLPIEIEDEPELARRFREDFEQLQRHFRQDPNQKTSFQTRLQELAVFEPRLEYAAGDSFASTGVLGSDPELTQSILQGDGAAVVTTVTPCLTGGMLASFFRLTTAAAAVKRAARLASRPVAVVAWLDRANYTPPDTLTVDTTGELVELGEDAVLSSLVRSALAGCSHLEELCELFEDHFGELWQQPVTESCQSDLKLRRAYAGLMAELFADPGIVVIDEANPAVAKKLAPFFHTALSRSSTLNRAFRARAMLLRRDGINVGYPPLHAGHLRYRSGDGSAAQFYQVELRQGRAVGKGREGRPAFSYSLSTFLRVLKSAPERFTPNSQLRPLAQTHVLPVLGLVSAPEHLQLQVLAEEAYELLELGTPVSLLAQRHLLVPHHIQELLDQYDLVLPDVWNNLETRREQLIQEADELELAGRERRLKAGLKEAVREAAAGLEKLDPGLEEEAAALVDQLHAATESFFASARESHRQDQAGITQDFRALHNWLYPRRQHQWNVFTPLPFAAEYGLQIVESLASLPPDPVPQAVPLRPQ